MRFSSEPMRNSVRAQLSRSIQLAGLKADLIDSTASRCTKALRLFAAITVIVLLIICVD